MQLKSTKIHLSIELRKLTNRTRVFKTLLLLDF